MIKLELQDVTLYDEIRNEFIYIKGDYVTFEHSLYAIREWEGEHKKAFLSKNTHSKEELRDYMRCMALPYDLHPELITDNVFITLMRYIEDTRSATKISHKDNVGGIPKDISAEVTYSMMAELGIPFEADKWNLFALNRLIETMTTRANPKKMSTKDIYKENNDLNEARKKKYNTKG